VSLALSMNRFVSYEGLPIKAGGAHGLGRKTNREAYSETNAFLKLYTDNTVPHSLTLTLYKADTFDFRSIKWQLMKRFGLFPRNETWDFGDAKQKLWIWTLRPEKIEEGLNFLEAHGNLPDHEYGPLTLNVLWHFRLVDPVTKQEIPNQELIPVLDERINNSRALLTLKRKSTLSVWFAFPFDKQDSKFMDYLDGFTKNLPFKPSDKHWRLWKKGKNGDWRPNKIDINH
jgi:hypothetical protein